MTDTAKAKSLEQRFAREPEYPCEHYYAKRTAAAGGAPGKPPTVRDRFMQLAASVTACGKGEQPWRHQPSNDELLRLYGLYKQVYEGDCQQPAPSGVFDRKGRQKWEAWQARRGMSQLDAMQAYIDLAEETTSARLGGGKLNA